MDIELLGKGAIPDPPDERDYKAEEVFGAPIVDWHNPENGRRFTRIKYWRNQKSSLSCGGQGTAYASDIIKGYPDDPASARSIYAFVHMSNGGSSARDCVMRVIKPGIASQSQAPDPKGTQATETNYRKKDDITIPELESGREADAYVLPGKSIDWVAWGIQEHKAVVYGFGGNNYQWKNKVYPTPPPNTPGTSPEWLHLTCGADFHICSDGQKCIITLSSWVDQAGDIQSKVHHIKENYFNSGFTFNPWVIIPRNKEHMKLVNDNGVYYIVGNKGKIGIADPKALEILKMVTDLEETGSVNVPEIAVFEKSSASLSLK